MMGWKVTVLNEEKLTEIIGEFIDEYPLCDYFFIKTDDLTLTPEVKTLCDQDAAIYGERRKVPPAPDSYAKCEAEIRKYDHAFLFDAVYEVSDAYDLERCEEARREHAALVESIRSEFSRRFGKTMALSISCDLCDDCPCPKKPCLHKDRAIYSMDSYGVRIMKTLVDRDIMYDYGISAAIYFSLILFDSEEDS